MNPSNFIVFMPLPGGCIPAGAQVPKLAVPSSSAQYAGRPPSALLTKFCKLLQACEIEVCTKCTASSYADRTMRCMRGFSLMDVCYVC